MAAQPSTSLALLTLLMACAAPSVAPAPVAIQSGVLNPPTRPVAQEQAPVVPTPVSTSEEDAAAAREVAQGSSNFGRLDLVPGFRPDPFTANGQSGGAVNATSLNRRCTGWVSQTPDHLLMAQGVFSDLRIMAKSPGDITLVVRMPDGTYRCNDDRHGTNPLVSGEVLPGVYGIWVGSYEHGTNHAYTLGISEVGDGFLTGP